MTSTGRFGCRGGLLRESGLAELVRDRGRQAGIADRLHPHAFRHAYAHHMLTAGLQETDLMAIAGWRSRDMVARYATGVATPARRTAVTRPSLAIEEGSRTDRTRR